jgi:hypothetical protein
MGKSSRDKGARGEREVAKILGLRRNLSQSRDGEDDLDHPDWYIEVKRCEARSLGAWWAKAERQAKGRRIMIWHRPNSAEWQVYVRLSATEAERLIAFPEYQDPIP